MPAVSSFCVCFYPAECLCYSPFVLGSGLMAVRVAVQECELKMEIIEMLLFHIAFSLALIALVSGVAFFMWSTHVKSSRKKLIEPLNLSKPLKSQ